MSNDKTVGCQITITALVECTNKDCDCIFDLFEMESLTDDGYLYRELLSDEGFGKKNFGEIVQCPECSEKITIGDVSY